MPYFGYFGTRILKNYCHTLNYHLRTRLIQKSRKKMKIPRNWKKNFFFEYFSARI